MVWYSTVAQPSVQGRNYPIWVREQGVGRNKSSEVSRVAEVTRILVEVMEVM